MYNQSLVKGLKLLGGLLLFLIVFALGYGSATIQSKLAEKTQQATTAQSTTEDSETSEATGLTEEEVENFLIAYYTRKDLGENQSRYKPFMTEGLYAVTVENESSPLQLSYKGYFVDQVFQSAKIYVDKTNKTALVEARYTTLVLEEKDNREGYSYTQESVVTLRLTYVETDKGLLLNSMDNIVLTDNTSTVAGTYSDLVPASSTEATSTTESSE